MGTWTRPTDDRLQSEVQVGPDKLEMVAFFCCLIDNNCFPLFEAVNWQSLLMKEVQGATASSHIPASLY